MPVSPVHRQVGGVITAARATARATAPGVCGTIEGVALVYGVVDSWVTTFAPGCFGAEAGRIRKGKVRLYRNHGRALETGGMYDVGELVGVVRSLEDRQLADGSVVAWMVADLLDTEAGREVHEQALAAVRAGLELGLSVGMQGEIESEPVKVDGQRVDRIVRAGLREISIVGEPAVPGAQVLAARAQATPAGGKQRLATMAERYAAAAMASPPDRREPITWLRHPDPADPFAVVRSRLDDNARGRWDRVRAELWPTLEDREWLRTTYRQHAPAAALTREERAALFPAAPHGVSSSPTGITQSGLGIWW